MSERESIGGSGNFSDENFQAPPPASRDTIVTVEEEDYEEEERYSNNQLSNDIEDEANKFNTITSFRSSTAESVASDAFDKETLFFIHSDAPNLRIDYVLTYEKTKDVDKRAKRREFEANLRKQGLLLEKEGPSHSLDKVTGFVKIHAPWDELTRGAELMNLKKRIQFSKNIEQEEQEEQETGCSPCSSCSLEVGEPIIPYPEDYFTATFNSKNLSFYEMEEGKDKFFNPTERSLIVREILDRTEYQAGGHEKEDFHFGIARLLSEGIFKAAFPLHDGPYKTEADDPEPWAGEDIDRRRLYEAWARPGRMFFYQPLDVIRRYFGERIGIYFAWLGFYTTMLIPATIVGLAVFVYGVVTVWSDPVVKDVCETMADTVMCPTCDKKCDYWLLKDSCLNSKITHVFDNYATVFFASFMAIWATIFSEFWKRNQNEIKYDWDVANLELEERMRPEYEFTVKKRCKNPVTNEFEPFVPWYSSLWRTFTGFSISFFFILLVIAAIFSVLLYRIIVGAILDGNDVHSNVRRYSKIITAITAAVLNVIAILILNILYKKIAFMLTNLEQPRTDSEFQDSISVKMFLFQFVNFYGSIFYIAFLKGKLRLRPADTSTYLFGKYQMDSCDPSGCFFDLVVQLAVIMVAKQTINNAKELLIPWAKAWWKRRNAKKDETEEKLYMRWEQDYHLEEPPPLGLFEEYLEMMVQYGFVVLFVAAFPLGPVFALFNNVIEIRLDAYKFVCVWRRGQATKAHGIGVWQDILQVVTFIAVLTNAFMIAFTSEFVPKMAYQFTSDNSSLVGFVQNSLSEFNISDFTDVTRPEGKQEYKPPDGICRFPGYLLSPDDRRAPYGKTTFNWNMVAARLAFVILFEHVIFIVTWLINVLIPDMPSSVKQLQLYEMQLVKKARFDSKFAAQ